MSVDDTSTEILDVAVLGAGPAGLSASIYLSRAGLKCVTFSSGPIGGVLPEISDLANYPGFLGSGSELAGMMKKQAEQTGARIEYGTCTEVYRANDQILSNSPVARSTSTITSAPVTAPVALDHPPIFTLTVDGHPVHAHRVLVATGSIPKQLDLDLTKPVSYCALCDGGLVKGKNIVVVGGANSAVQEALYLSKIASRVTIISHSALKADRILRDKATRVTNIDIIEDIEPTAEFLDQFDHIFVYIGKKPASHCLSKLAGIPSSKDSTDSTDSTDSVSAADLVGSIDPRAKLLDSDGYVVTNSERWRADLCDRVNGDTLAIYLHETVVSGIFAAGDVHAGMIQQVVTAAADGVAAAIEIIDSMK